MTEIIATAITGLCAVVVCIINNKTLIKKTEKANKENLETLSKSQKEETESLKKGVQALLRAQMIHDWNKWSEEGYAPLYARENFENCWKIYHSLGMNGVMDGIHDKFMELPMRKKKGETK